MKSDLPDRTFAFAERIVKLCFVLEQNGRVPATLANQLLRSGTSIGANVEEGQASQSKADFSSKYSIACKEARETHYWLRLLASTELVPADRLMPLTDEANELIAILTTIIKKSRS
ncbi:MAG: four helix bundle protein [Planctomycetota bacterium]